MDKFSKFFLGAFLLALMTIVIVPVDYIHSLYNHNDTEDTFEFTHSTAIETSHIHCVILKTEFREFYNNDYQQLVSEEFYLGSIDFIYQNPSLANISSPKEQRGPPVSYC